MFDDGLFGIVICVDMWKWMSVVGVYVVGDVLSLMINVMFVLVLGVVVGVGVYWLLVFGLDV